MAPKISIIMPSFNQATFLERSIESVLMQDYSALELIVMDGGSTDESLQILQKYSDRLTYWESKRDRGQSDAINKGFLRSSGDVINWLCSDDELAPGALQAVGRYFNENPKTDILAGACRFLFEEEQRSEVSRCKADLLSLMPCLNPVYQPSCFFRRRLCREKLVREDLHYTMDGELWLYFMSKAAKWDFTDEVLSVYRVTGDNKSFTGGDRILRELEHLYETYVRERIHLTRWERQVWLPLARRFRGMPPTLSTQMYRCMAKGVSLGLRLFYGAQRVQALESQFGMYGVDQERARMQRAGG